MPDGKPNSPMVGAGVTSSYPPESDLTAIASGTIPSLNVLLSTGTFSVAVIKSCNCLAKAVWARFTKRATPRSAASSLLR